MKIGFNLLPYAPGRQGGAEVYIYNLIQALGELDTKHTFVLFITPQTKGMYLPNRSNFEEVILPSWIGVNRITRIIAEQLLLPFYAAFSNLDCLFSNYVVPLFVPFPVVVNVHDMLYKLMPELVEPLKRAYWQAMLPLSLKKSTTVMTVSNSSANDIVTFFPGVASKLFVTVEGVNRGLKIDVSADQNLILKELGIRQPFILSSATFGPHKNIRTLISAFAKVNEVRADLQLVLTGRANTEDANREKDKISHLIETLGISNSVIFTGYVPEQTLAALYHMAIIYVNPSLFEGFGLSVIEAQSFGSPVICSNIPALVEVGGKGVVAVSALSVEEFTQEIITILQDEKRRQHLIRLGYENVSRYSWQQAAIDLINVCEHASQSKPLLKYIA